MFLRSSSDWGIGILFMGRLYSFLYDLGQVWFATASLYIAATEEVSSGKNSSSDMVSKSPGTLHVILPFLRPSYTMWSGWVATGIFIGFQANMGMEGVNIEGRIFLIIIFGLFLR